MSAPWDRQCDEPECERTATTRAFALAFGTGITRETCNAHIPRDARATFALDD